MSQAASYLTVSQNTIRNWRDEGRLHPKKEKRCLANGARRVIEVYAREELERRRPRRESPDAATQAGEKAARAFKLFRDGTPLTDVVMEIQAPPQLVEELHEQWCRMGGSELVINPAAKAAFERIVGPFNGVADLLQRVEDLAKQIAGPEASTDTLAPP